MYLVSNTGGLSSVTVRMEYFVCFAILMLQTECGKPMRGEAGRIIVNFYHLGVL